MRYTPRLDGDGAYIGYYATTSDIHEQKMVEEELRRANSILSAHFDNTPLAVIEWDPELRIVRWSGQRGGDLRLERATRSLGRSLAGWRLVYEEDEARRASEMVQRPDRRAASATRRSSIATTARTAR